RLAFYYHLFFAIASALVIQYYFGYGDTCYYYSYSVDLRQTYVNNTGLFWTKFNSNLSWSTGRFMDITAILNLFSFSSYPALMLFFCYFSYTGILRLIITMYDYYPHLKKQLYWAVFFLPTLNFYGAIVLKDTLVIGCLGWMAYSSMMIFKKKEFKLTYILILISTLFLLLMVRNFVLIAIILCIGILYIVTSVKKLFDSKYSIIKKIAFVAFFLLLSIISLTPLSDKYFQQVSDSIVQEVLQQQNGYELVKEEGDSGIQLSIKPENITSLSSFIKLAPESFINGVFRPFPWDSFKLFNFILSLETFVLFIFFIYYFFKNKIFYFFKIIFSDNILLSGFSFVVVYGIMVGLTTLNLGTIVRYRIPVLPFLILVLLYFGNISKTKNVGFAKQRN
ncbi:MAG: hypothetical protein ABIP30_05870, partial [Ferruginibacter sp.]